MKLHNFLAVAAAAMALSGCATIIKGTTQSVSLDSTPVQGAACTLVNSEGTWFVATPGSITVHKTKTDITATCKKDGYQDAIQTIPSHFNGATAGNIIAGGLIGIGVDAASGANYSYPDTPTMITLVPVAAASATPSAPASAPATAQTPSH